MSLISYNLANLFNVLNNNILVSLIPYKSLVVPRVIDRLSSRHLGAHFTRGQESDPPSLNTFVAQLERRQGPTVR